MQKITNQSGYSVIKLKTNKYFSEKPVPEQTGNLLKLQNKLDFRLNE